MRQAKAVLKVILAYITLKSGCIQHKPKCTKNAGIRLVVPKIVGSNPISHPSAEFAQTSRVLVLIRRDFLSAHEANRIKNNGTPGRSEVPFSLVPNLKSSMTACNHIGFILLTKRL